MNAFTINISANALLSFEHTDYLSAEGVFPSTSLVQVRQCSGECRCGRQVCHQCADGFHTAGGDERRVDQEAEGYILRTPRFSAGAEQLPAIRPSNVLAVSIGAA